MDPFQGLPQRGHGAGGQNPNIIPVDDPFDQHHNGPPPRSKDYDELDEMMGNHHVSGPSKAANDKNKGKDKDQKAKKAPLHVEVAHEGFIITKAPPPRGEKASWARSAKRPMPFDDAKLKATALAYQQRTGLGPMERFTSLSDTQQSVVHRVIADRNAQEKQANAEWVLASVEKVEEDVPISFFRMGRTCTKMRVIIRRQDASPMTPAEKKKETAATLDLGEIIDLTVPAKTPKNNSKENNGNSKKNGNAKGNGKKHAEFIDARDDPIVGAWDNNRPASGHRQYQLGNQNIRFEDDPFQPQHQDQNQNHGFDIPPPPRHPQPGRDPFAPMNQQQPDPFAPHHQQHDKYDRPDPFAGADMTPQGPPPGAIPIPGYHQQQPPFHDHNAPPPAPMPPNQNPFLPEVGAQEQWGAHLNNPWTPEQPGFGSARIAPRPYSRSRSESRRREESRRRSHSRRRRREDEERDQREASEERRRRRRDNQQDTQLRKLTTTVEKLADKVEHWDAGSLPSSTTSTDQDDMWSLPRSLDTPATSPDRERFRRKPPGSLHQRRDSAHALPRPKYYQDRRGPRYADERVEIQPGLGRHERDFDNRGRDFYPSDRAFVAGRPRLQHARTFDDYPVQPRYVKPVRHVEPRMQRRLTDFPQDYEDAEFDRRGGRGVDFTRMGRYERDFDNRRAGDRERRRYNVVGGDGYYN